MFSKQFSVIMQPGNIVLEIFKGGEKLEERLLGRGCRTKGLIMRCLNVVLEDRGITDYTVAFDERNPVDNRYYYYDINRLSPQCSPACLRANIFQKQGVHRKGLRQTVATETRTSINVDNGNNNGNDDNGSVVSAGDGASSSVGADKKTVETHKEKVDLLHKHTSQLHKKDKKLDNPPLVYVAFSAAYDGCLPCVQRLVEQHGVSPRDTNDSDTHSLYDFALWGCENNPCQSREVVDYLAAHTPGLKPFSPTKKKSKSTKSKCSADTPGSSGCISSGSAFNIPLGIPHQHCSQVKKKAKKNPPLLYVAFSAAYEGCKTCVELLVEKHGVTLQDRSDSGSYTIMDFATWGCEQNAGQSREVVEYLEGLVPPCSSTESARLLTPAGLWLDGIAGKQPTVSPRTPSP